MPLYKHCPIDLATDAIRLVRLRRGYSTDQIRCELFDAFLHQIEGVPFEALSYTWGDVSNPAMIKIGENDTLPVAGNLYAALHCLRHSDQDRILWIDAICIDQTNDEEKGHQVRHMRLIYKNAERVLIWLGRSSDDIDLLVDMMEKLDKRALRKGLASNKSLEGWKPEWLDLLDEYGGNKTDFYQRRHRALAELLQRPWFTRVWVLQEAASAKRASILVGWRSIPSRTFVMMPSLMEVPCDKHAQAVLDIMPGPLRLHSWWSANRSLHTLIKAFHNSKASDPRDKLYALLGLSSDAHDGEVLLPDYSITVQRAVRDTISFLIFRRILDHSTYEFPDWNLHVFIQNIEQLPQRLFQWALDKEAYSVALDMINGEATGVDEKILKSIKEETLLDLAESGSHPRIMEAILESNVDPNPMRSGETPLNIATKNGHTEIVRLLLNHDDINLSHRDSEWLTPLCAAVELGHYEVSESILSHKNSGVNIASGKVVSSPLWRAAEQGNERLFKLLLDNGADTEAWNTPESRSTLAIAIEKGNLTLVKLLIQEKAESGADSLLESKSLYGSQTPLMIAADHGCFAIIQYLIDQGANIDSTSTNGRTALGCAAAKGSVDVVRCLINHSPDVNHRDETGRTPLAIAAKNGNVKVVRILADSGAELNCQDLLGRTPLALAAKLLHISVVKVLLEKGCDVTTPDFAGNTALSLATSTNGKPSRKETEIVRMIKNKEFQDYLARRKKGLE